MLIGPLEEIVGRAARANPTAVAAAAGELSPRSPTDKIRERTASDDQAYLGFLARQVESPEQFNELIEKVSPQMRQAVRQTIWKKLKPEVQARIPDPAGGRPS